MNFADLSSSSSSRVVKRFSVISASALIAMVIPVIIAGILAGRMPLVIPALLTAAVAPLRAASPVDMMVPHVSIKVLPLALRIPPIFIMRAPVDNRIMSVLIRITPVLVRITPVVVVFPVISIAVPTIEPRLVLIVFIVSIMPLATLLLAFMSTEAGCRMRIA